MSWGSFGTCYYGVKPDHMNVLNRYREYKVFWDRHRIPGEYNGKEPVLWEDPWWKAQKNAKKKPRRLPPLKKTSASKKPPKTDKESPKSEGISEKESGSSKSNITVSMPTTDQSESAVTQSMSTVTSKNDSINQKNDEEENKNRSRSSSLSSRSSHSSLSSSSDRELLAKDVNSGTA